MYRSAGVVLMVMAFCFTSAGLACKGKDKDSQPSKKPVTPKRVDKQPPTPTKSTTKDDVKPLQRPPVPVGFAEKATAFYADTTKVLETEKSCRKLGTHLLSALNANKAMLNAYVGTADGAKWRAANKPLLAKFQAKIGDAVPRCARDQVFQKWLQQIQALATKQQHDVKGDGQTAVP